jgi:hypothetical protein
LTLALTLALTLVLRLRLRLRLWLRLHAAWSLRAHPLVRLHVLKRAFERASMLLELTAEQFWLGN